VPDGVQDRAPAAITGGVPVLRPDEADAQRRPIKPDSHEEKEADESRAHESILAGILPPMRLAADHLSRSLGGRRIFGPISFEVLDGRVLGIAGNNGAGKTTLLKVLAGLLRPTAGSILLAPRDGAPPLAPRDASRHLGWAAPDFILYGELTAMENLTFFSRLAGDGDAVSRAAEALVDVDLDPAKQGKLLTRSLSTGQRQRLKLAAATLHEPELLLLDEPGANLDEAGRAIVSKVVATQRRRGIAVIASNDARDLGLADEVLKL
jgi:heme exporter protein A